MTDKLLPPRHPAPGNMKPQVEAKPNGAAPPPDADDIAALWDDPGIGDPLTSGQVHSVPIGKPRDFFRTHPDTAYRQSCEIYCHKPENIVGEEFFLIAAEMKGHIPEARPCTLVCVVDRIGMPRLWPIMRPRDGERDNAAWVTARTVARAGLSRWVKLIWQGRSYVSREADAGYAPDPDWAKLPAFNELVRKAFGNNGIIWDESHPIYRDLFGKVSRPGGASDDLLA
jgi:hypothetical protein